MGFGLPPPAEDSRKQLLMEVLVVGFALFWKTFLDPEFCRLCRESGFNEATSPLEVPGPF